MRQAKPRRKTTQKEAPQHKYEIWSIVLTCFFVISFLAMGFPGSTMHNTFRALQLGLLAVVPGAMVGWMTAWLIVNTEVFTKKTRLDNDYFFLALIPSFVFLSVAAAFHINTHWGEAKSFQTKAIVIEKSPKTGFRYRSRRAATVLDVQYAGGVKSILVNRDIWKKTAVNDTVTLDVRRGYFGYLVVTGLYAANEYSRVS